MSVSYISNRDDFASAAFCAISGLLHNQSFHIQGSQLIMHPLLDCGRPGQLLEDL